MADRRNFLKLGLAAGVFGAGQAFADDDLLRFLCSPDGIPPQQITNPSPPARPFVAELFIPPVKQPVPSLDPPPVPSAHQQYERFAPKKFYEIRESEFRWVYHPDPPYDVGSWAWGFDGMTPGPTYHAKYGEPVLVRMVNDLPPLGHANIQFAMPSTTTHLHNAHTPAESDGYPMLWIDTGEFWDHHYVNYESGGDPHERLTTLWYHDHRMDFTAANVYAGLDGFYLLFDDQDTGDENDPNPRAWRLPSGKYDVPLILHDVLFDQYGQPAFNSLNTDGILGDKFTVNRKIQPFFRVERRKYRFRFLNGGPSRFYQLRLSAGANRDKTIPFIVITGDGNFLPTPVCAENVYISVAQRVDVIVDFSQFKAGDHVFLENRLQQTNGRGPSGRMLDIPDEVMRFDVIERTAEDPSRIPDFFRDLPKVDCSAIKRHREWTFDYVGGLWTINGKIFEPDRIDAEIEQGSAEIWTLRNEGKNWAHPIHSHFTEFLLLEVNGFPVAESTIQSRTGRRNEFLEVAPKANATALAATGQNGQFNCNDPRNRPVPVFMGGKRRDVTTLLPGDEIKIYFKWTDFLGTYVMHCHNVVHEDHAMMIRWDIVPAKNSSTGEKVSIQVCDVLEEESKHGSEQQ